MSAKETVITRKDKAETLKVMGAEVTFLCQAEKTAKQWSLMEVSLPRHAGPPAHEHPWDECYYILEGEVDFQLGEQKLIAKAGDFLYAPEGTVHAFQGASEKPARVLVFDAPAAAEGFFRDAHNEVKQIPADLPKVPAIGKRHRINFLPPR